MSKLCWKIENEKQWLDTNVVKVIRNRYNHAIYFSRTAIPANRDKMHDSWQQAFRHIGIYGYLASFLIEITQTEACDLELCEALEQLRILWMGYKIQVEIACVQPLQDINTANDLALAQQYLTQKANNG